MTTKYRLVMSDGNTHQKSASSAGEAIYSALVKFPGRTVTKCHSGLTEAEAAEHRAMGKSGPAAMPGFIEYDIPTHNALTEADACKACGED